MKRLLFVFLSAFLTLPFYMALAEENSPVSGWDVIPTSLVTRAEPARQRAEITVNATRDFGPVRLEVQKNDALLVSQELGNLEAGANDFSALLPADTGEVETRWVLKDGEGKTIAERRVLWKTPRPWTLYVVSSTHCDIGLHNSQYVQRKMSSEYIEQAVALADQTKDWPDASRYRYVMEGTWFWGNFWQDRSPEAARRIVDEYIHTGLLGVGATCAGNHTQVYGFEELCRSAYTRRALRERWGLDVDTMIMSDNNGMTWSLVAPYADAGIRNIFFCPNQWNPLKSTIWPMDESKLSATWNPDAGGGGSRVDVRYDSPLPMVFYWRGADEKSKILVWCSTQYDHGGSAFGWCHRIKDPKERVSRMGRQLAKLEKRYLYDIWLFANYQDDERPNLYNARGAKEWNEQWRYPEIRTVGDLSEPFAKLRERFDGAIPTLRGDMTSGWSQHPICAPELLADKFATDRELPTAEKLASLASLVDPEYRYPTEDFRRAWDALIWNDEHSYGTSGYQGRRVYETWLQHRDWIEKAQKTAHDEMELAWSALASKVRTSETSLLIFNPTLQTRTEYYRDGQSAVEVPPFGYTTIPMPDSEAEHAGFVSFQPSERSMSRETPAEPPVLENRFYKIVFAKDGSIASIFDKELNRELLDPAAAFRCNQFVYTKDNHQTFTSPQNATFELRRGGRWQEVLVKLEDAATQASVEQLVTLPDTEKRIDITNRFSHVHDLINKHRYHRYGYYAFPFFVPEGTFYAQLNGSIVTPQKDVTGHGTDAYLAVRDWICIENGNFGVALIQQDSHLVEFGKIHPDKTCFGEKIETSHLYSYLFTDWLQMHTPGGSFVNPRYRYTITSYAGDYRTGKIPQLAERIMTPCLRAILPPQEGTLPATHSFLSADQDVSFVNFKAAEKPGAGYIVRLWEPTGREIPRLTLRANLPGEGWHYAECSVLEDDRAQLDTPTFSLAKSGFKTLRLENEVKIKERAISVPSSAGPAPIGSVYTGLIDQPRAVNGEKFDQLYLEWGQNMEPDLSHYELYRSETSGFAPDSTTFLADVPPGEYRVGRYEDRNLKGFTRYYYRVRAVNCAGEKSPFSAEFSAVTREPYRER